MNDTFGINYSIITWFESTCICNNREAVFLDKRPLLKILKTSIKMAILYVILRPFRATFHRMYQHRASPCADMSSPFRA